jgi:ADP-ribosylglycohydrolase
MDLEQRLTGSMLGLAIGDALGHPTEFMASVDAIRARYGPRGVTGFEPAGRHRAGTFTDDTQMAICVARALSLGWTDSMDARMALLAREFVAWANHPSNNRAPGGTCMTGCARLAKGVAWREAGVPESKGCGAAMRAAPIAWFLFDDEDALVLHAAAQSALTHRHPTAIASSVAAAAPVAWILQGHGLEGMLDYTRNLVARVTPELLVSVGCREADALSIGAREQIAILNATERALAKDDDDVCALLGGAWVGEEAVACALWCVLKSQGRFEDAVLRGANSSGDSDSIACIAGSILGASVGLAGLPRAWVDGVERSSDLEALALGAALAKQSGQAPSTLRGSVDFFDREASLTDLVGD